MQDRVLEKLEQIRLRSLEIVGLLAREEIINNFEEYTRLNKEYANTKEIVDRYIEYNECMRDIDTAKELLQDASMREFAQEEIAQTKEKLISLEQALEILLLPKDENDDRNIFLEIRAGTGGTESTLFSADLFRMYTRFAENNRWRVEIISSSTSDLGGYKEIIAKIIGFGAYSRLKFESGTHRVQRVPVTETQGRVHTSACTVAVLPELDQVGDVEINPADLKIDTFRASGAGGQHVNTTDSAIRITHIPTGIVVECQDDRSQHRNRALAMSWLGAKIKAEKIRQQHSQIATERKSMIGSGDRSEKIRTYNFSQDRVTDHRINLTLYKLGAIMNGDLDEIINALTLDHQTKLLVDLA